MTDTLSEPSKIVELLNAINSALVRHNDQILLEQLGVGLSQFRILSCLQTASVSQRELADVLNQTEPAVSRQIKLLNDKGLIQISVNEAEKRKNMVSLNSSGLKIVIAAAELLESENHKIVSQLNRKQQANLVELLQKIDLN